MQFSLKNKKNRPSKSWGVYDNNDVIHCMPFIFEKGIDSEMFYAYTSDTTHKWIVLDLGSLGTPTRKELTHQRHSWKLRTPFRKDSHNGWQLHRSWWTVMKARGDF